MTRRGLSGVVAELRLESPVRTIVAIAARPGLWDEVVRLAWRTGERRRPGGRPHSPLPSPAYLGFRAEAMLGGGARGLRAEEAVAYLAWVRRMRQLQLRAVREKRY